jgi:uncharacterized protein
MSPSLPERLRAFLKEHNTMTLATVNEAGQPEAAAVFYAETEGFSFYFLAERTSRHGRNLERRPEAAATIHADGQQWATIQGLQVEGLCRQVPPGERPKALAVYAAKFPFVISQPELWARLGAVDFYLLQPHWLRLIDNRLGFGHKDELRLDGPPGHEEK